MPETHMIDDVADPVSADYAARLVANGTHYRCSQCSCPGQSIYHRITP